MENIENNDHDLIPTSQEGGCNPRLRVVLNA